MTAFKAGLLTAAVLTIIGAPKVYRDQKNASKLHEAAIQESNKRRG